MKKLLLFIFLIPFVANSQGINNLWLMGYESWNGRPYGGVNFDFSSGVLDTSYHNRKMNFHETIGIISDKNGNLQFSSNGGWISNAYNDTMTNGSDLNPSYYTSNFKDDGLTITQGNIVIPLNDPNKYYLFHLTADDYPYTNSALHLYYSIIDMSLDSGKGVVVQKNITLLNDSIVPGMLSACKHGNGRDWWLTLHEFDTNKFYEYLITPFFIQGPFFQNIGVSRGFGRGQSSFSPEGKKYAYYLPNFNSPHHNALDVFDFDRCTGIFSNVVSLNLDDSANVGGVAFSSNSQVLYVSSDVFVYQFDLSSSNIIATKTIVAVWDSTYSPSWPFATTFFQSQLAPDGKIYINCGNSTLDMHVINYPNIIGNNCDVCQHCVHLPAYNAWTIPNYPNYFLDAENGSPCDSLPHVGIEELSSSINFKVYPNPVSNNDEVTFIYP